jgi:tetratricopeptide (TPR) repeat protein
MPPSQRPVTDAALPDPSSTTGLDELVERLRLLKIWAGDPSYETIKDRVNAAWTAAGRPASELTIRSTVANCFTLGRRRLNTDLILAVVEALHPDVGYVTQWHQALRVVGGEIEAVAQVRVQDSLPRDLAGFTGRVGELDRLRRARKDGDAVVISAIEGMAGVGKTQLAVHAGHLLHLDDPFDRVLFVNLRGFHPDPTQPPADPAAVLDGFLRLLGTPGHQIPHDLPARAAAYRDRLAGTRALILLDNAATADQVQPLLPDTPGCLTLITSRRALVDLHPGTRLAVDVFTPAEAAAFLTRAVPGNDDPDAVARIAHRCGHLPLALSLIAGHIRNTPGWTLADHADRLDERHRQQRLDTGVELALTLSYQHLPGDEQRLLRLAALHPGQDFDAYAAAALTGTDLVTAQAQLDDLRRDHLLQQAAGGRYTFHDLVRAFAIGHAHDEDPPADRRTALTRLFDHYVTATATAVEILYPGVADLRWPIPPAGTPRPGLTDPETALAWLDTERPTLVAVTAHSATHGWPSYAVRLSRILARHLSSGRYADAVLLHGHAYEAAVRSGDLAGQAHILANLGYIELRQGLTDAAAEKLRESFATSLQTDDLATRGQVLQFLAAAEDWSGRYPAAIEHQRHALGLYRQMGDRNGESVTLNSLAHTLEKARRFPEAIDYYEQGLALARAVGARKDQAFALQGLADVEVQSGRYQSAGDHLQEALAVYRDIGHRLGEAGVLDSLGTLHTRLGRLDQAVESYQRAVTVFRDIGTLDGEAWAVNGLGEAAHAAGRHADAVTQHTAVLAIGSRDQQARAHLGLGHAYRALGETAPAREHYQQAATIYADLGLPGADEIHARLAELGR